MASKSSSSKHSNSLELIEECLDQIYRCRKSSLLARARKYKEKEDRLRVSGTQPLRPVLQSPGRTVEGEDYWDEDGGEDDEEQQDRQLLKELAVKFSAPPLKSVAHSSSHKKQAAAPTGGPKVTQQPRPHIAAVDSSTAEAEEIADSAYGDFCVELSTWLESHSKEVVADDDIRAEFADQLVHSYLSSNLDLLPASRRVSEVRRLLSSTIEEFVSSTAGAQRLSLGGMRQRHAVGKSVTESSTKAAVAAPSTVSAKKVGIDIGASTTHTFEPKDPPNVTPNSQSTANSIPPKTKSAASAAAAEKAKIKQQYENFMAMKRKAEAHPDHAALEQYSALNDDIQSLLTSLQSTNAAATK